MPNLSAYAQKLTLDFLLGVAPSAPGARYVGLALGTPTSVNGTEVQPASGYVRQTGLFNAAASPAGSMSNSAAMTFGPFSSSAAIQGVQIWDTSAFTAGNMLMYGTLSVARTVQTGDQIVFPVGSLITTVS